MNLQIDLPPPEAFVEFPGMRGLRIARVGQADGKTLEIIEGVKDVIIPAMQHPGAEQGRVLSGAIRFMQEGTGRTLRAGDVWSVEAGAPQGPHVFLENDTRVAILRDGKSALDV